jgi:hypothetical protein
MLLNGTAIHWDYINLLHWAFSQIASRE